jgi:hypothetical protein
MPVLIGYLGLWWGGVVGAFILVTSNSAPPPPSIGWESEEPQTNTKLAVEILEDSADADGDKVDYFYRWTRDGELVEDKTGSSVSARDTMSGEVWEVTVTPNDGTFEGWGCDLFWRDCAEMGRGEVAMSVTIGNTAPRARIRFVDADGEEFVDDEASNRKDIHLKLSCFDSDIADRERRAKEEAKKAAAAAAAAGIPPEPEPEPEEVAEGEEVEEEEEEDPCTYTINWWKSDEEPDEDEVSEQTEIVLSSRTTSVDDSWRAVVVASDGEDEGEPQEESIKIIR